jgi:hypothetical protein
MRLKTKMKPCGEYLQSKESERSAEHHMLSICLEGRRRTGELGWRRGADCSSTSWQYSCWLQSRRNGVRRSSSRGTGDSSGLTGRSLRRRNTGDKANRSSGRGARGWDLGSEVHCRDCERRGAVCNSRHGHAGSRSTGRGRSTSRRRSTRCWHAGRRRSLYTTGGCSRRAVVEGVLGAVGN